MALPVLYFGWALPLVVPCCLAGLLFDAKDGLGSLVVLPVSYFG